MKRYFGTDGIRTRAGNFPLQPAPLEALGAALANELARRHGDAPRIVIGGDTRESTAWIAACFARGVEAVGGTVACAGVIPTPGVAFLAKTGGFHAGVVVSASHNPFEDNGIKIFLPSGEKQDADLERLLEAALEALAVPAGRVVPDDIAPLWDDPALALNYVEFLTRRVGEDLDLSKFTIALDCANGAASFYASTVFQALGARTFVTAASPDGRNINFDCGSLHLDNLSKFVREVGADFGVAFDGDADRCLMVDAGGTPVDGDAILFLMANHFDARGELNPRAVVATVMSNLGLEVALRDRGIELRRTPVGDKYVLEELLQTGAAVGGEQSGHVIFPRRSLAGDGLMTALTVVSALAESKTTLRDALTGFETFPQILVNVRVREKVPFEEVPAIAAAARETEAHFADRGRLLLRYSGTENLARVMIEGEHKADVIDQAHRLADLIRRELGE